MSIRNSAFFRVRNAPGKLRSLGAAPAVALAAAVALPLSIVAAPLAAQRTSESSRSCDGCDLEDSLAAVQREYERVRADYERIASKAMQQRVAEMRARLETNRREHEKALSRLQVMSSAPAGWLGLTFSGSYTVVMRDAEKSMMRFETYPTVEAVDPGSPAERAGIKAGDELLALDGHDLKDGSPPFSELLRPGARLNAKVKRGERTRTVTITVGKRPSNYAFDWGDWSASMIPAPPATAAVPAPPAPEWGEGSEARALVRALRPSVAIRAMPSIPALAPMVEAWSLSGSGSPMLSFGVSAGVIAGAQVQRVNELSDYFGVKDGLLVLHVMQGTPAARAGLRPGDVIRRAGDRTITTPSSLQRALAASDSHALALDVVRKGKARSIELKWD